MHLGPPSIHSALFFMLALISKAFVAGTLLPACLTDSEAPLVSNAGNLVYHAKGETCYHLRDCPRLWGDIG